MSKKPDEGGFPDLPVVVFGGGGNVIFESVLFCYGLRKVGNQEMGGVVFLLPLRLSQHCSG